MQDKPKKRKKKVKKPKVVERVATMRVQITVAAEKHPKVLKVGIPVGGTTVKGSSEHNAALAKARDLMSSINDLRFS